MCRPHHGWLVGCLLFVVPGTTRGAEEVVVGMSAAFNGPSRGLGIELYRGAMACFAEVNSKGGLHGRKIVLKAYDDEYNPDPAIANTRKLILEDDAFLLFGYVGLESRARKNCRLRFTGAVMPQSDDIDLRASETRRIILPSGPPSRVGERPARRAGSRPRPLRPPESQPR